MQILKKKYWLLLLVLAIAAFLRFLPAAFFQFSHDELSALSRTIFPDLRQTVLYGVEYTDTHPLLVQVFLYYWVKLGGYGEFWVKLPFLICGLLSVWYLFKIGDRWFGYQVGVFAALLSGCSLLFIYYSTQARLYAPGTLFGLLLLHNCLSLIAAPSVSVRPYIAYAFWALLCALTNHLCCLYALTVGMATLFLLPGERRWKFLLASLASLICYLPHLPITLSQLAWGGLGEWLPVPRPSVAWEFLYTLSGNGKASWIIVGCLLLGLIYTLRISRKPNKLQCFLLSIFLINAGIIYVYSIYKSPVLQFSVLLFSAPCLVLAASAWMKPLPPKLFHGLSLLAILSLLWTLVVDKNYFGLALRQDFEEEVRVTVDQKRLVGNSNVDAIYKAEPYFVYFYQHKYKKGFSYKLSTDSCFATPASTRRYLAGLRSNYMVVGNVDVTLQALVQEYYPHIAQHEESYFMNYTVYSKLPIDRGPYPVLDRYTWEHMGPFVPDPDRLKWVGQEQVLPIAANSEFPMAMKADVDRLPMQEGRFLMITATVQADTLPRAELLIAMSVQKADSALFFTSTNASSFAASDSTNAPFKAYAVLYIGSNYPDWKGGQLACFFWNTGHRAYTVCDFKIEWIDYNPHRWVFWR